MAVDREVGAHADDQDQLADPTVVVARPALRIDQVRKAQALVRRWFAREGQRFELSAAPHADGNADQHFWTAAAAPRPEKIDRRGRYLHQGAPSITPAPAT